MKGGEGAGPNPGGKEKWGTSEKNCTKPEKGRTGLLNRKKNDHKAMEGGKDQKKGPEGESFFFPGMYQKEKRE